MGDERAESVLQLAELVDLQALVGASVFQDFWSGLLIFQTGFAIFMS